MVKHEESVYELNRASFSATVGLSFLALSTTIKINGDVLLALATILTVLFGLTFWAYGGMHYLRHLSARKIVIKNWRDVGKFF